MLRNAIAEYKSVAASGDQKAMADAAESVKAQAKFLYDGVL